jgi:hypothetical protein
LDPADIKFFNEHGSKLKNRSTPAQKTPTAPRPQPQAVVQPTKKPQTRVQFAQPT